MQLLQVCWKLEWFLVHSILTMSESSCQSRLSKGGLITFWKLVCLDFFDSSAFWWITNKRKEGREGEKEVEREGRKEELWQCDLSHLFSLSEEDGLCDLLYFNHNCSSLSFSLLAFHSPCSLGISEEHEVDPFQTFLVVSEGMCSWRLSLYSNISSCTLQIQCHHCCKLVLEWQTKD